MTTAASTQNVEEIMTRNPVCVDVETTARELARLLESDEISGVPVIDQLERLVGVVSRTDLLRRCVEGPLGSNASLFEALADGIADDDLFPENIGTVGDMMSPDVVTAMPTERVSAIARRMAENGVHRLIIIDEDQRVVGVVTSLDVLRVFPT